MARKTVAQLEAQVADLEARLVTARALYVEMAAVINAQAA